MQQVYTTLLIQGNVAAIHYEYFLANPAQAIERLCDFSGESFETTMLEYFRQQATLQEAGNVKNWSNTGQPILAENYQKFLNAFSAEDLQQIEQAAYYGMHLCDYPFAGRQGKKGAGKSLSEPVKKAGQLLGKMMTGKIMSLKEMNTRKQQIQARHTINQRLREELTPLFKRQYATYFQRT